MSANATISSAAKIPTMPPGMFSFSKKEMLFHYTNLNVSSVSVIIFFISTWQCAFYLYRNREHIYGIGLAMSFSGFLVNLLRVIWAFLFHVDCFIYVNVVQILTLVLLCFIEVFSFIRMAEWIKSKAILLVGAGFFFLTIGFGVCWIITGKTATTLIGVCLPVINDFWNKLAGVALSVQFAFLVVLCLIASVREKNTQSLQQFRSTLFERGFIMLVMAFVLGTILKPIANYAIGGRYGIVFSMALQTIMCRLFVEQLRSEDTMRHGPRIVGISSFGFKLSGDEKRLNTTGSSGAVTSDFSGSRSTGSNFAPFASSVHAPDTTDINVSGNGGAKPAYAAFDNKQEMGFKEEVEVPEYLMSNLSNIGSPLSHTASIKHHAESLTTTVIEEDMSDSTIPPPVIDSKITWPDSFP